MQSVGASRKVFEFIDRDPVIKNDGTVNNLQLAGKIEFKNVKFSYPQRPDVPIMKVCQMNNTKTHSRKAS